MKDIPEADIMESNIRFFDANLVKTTDSVTSWREQFWGSFVLSDKMIPSWQAAIWSSSWKTMFSTKPKLYLFAQSFLPLGKQKIFVL